MGFRQLDLVYVHFPKAAGTSLIHELRAHYGDALLADYTHIPPDDWSHDPAYAPEGIRAVCGHFHADRYAAYRPRFRFTFLREPIDNLVSIYFFWRRFPSTGYAAHDRFLAEKPSFVEFADYYELRYLASRHYFGGVNLERLDFVGFFERRREGLASLSSLIGIPLDADRHVNKTDESFAEERAELLADRRVIALVRNKLYDDVMFYEQAFERFSRRSDLYKGRVSRQAADSHQPQSNRPSETIAY